MTEFEHGEKVYMVGTIGKSPIEGAEAFIPKFGGYIITEKRNLIRQGEKEMGNCDSENKKFEYEISLDDKTWERLSGEISNDVYTPEMVSIPKSEYELLLEIKEHFIGGMN